MLSWPLPNLDIGDIFIPPDSGIRDNWFWIGETPAHGHHPVEIELPTGWGNPWPDLPNPDEHPSEFDLREIFLSNSQDPCRKGIVLGYYVSWHVVGVSYMNENGRTPRDGAELKEYNDSLPRENRFGIHVCCRTIEDYIRRFSTTGLESNMIPLYLEYCTFLTLIYVIAHEWGHYRSEVLSFQLSNLSRSIYGEDNNPRSPSFLSYHVNKKRFQDSNFEEVFAEWAALKLGIFNYFIKKPAFTNPITNWPQVEATVKFMLTQAIARSTRIRPYSDIRYWIDFGAITKDEVMERISRNAPSVNRSVNDNVVINGDKFLKRPKFMDMLMHNQMQFSRYRPFNGIVRSSPLAYPYQPDSAFYLLGDDECVEAKEGVYSDHYIRLGSLNQMNPRLDNTSTILKAVDGLKKDMALYAFLPVKVFPEILPLDPVYFHS